MITEDNGSNNSLFLSCQMGLSDGAFFMIKHTPLPNGNHPISSPVCPMGVADTLEPGLFSFENNLLPKLISSDAWIGHIFCTLYFGPYFFKIRIVGAD